MHEETALLWLASGAASGNAENTDLSAVLQTIVSNLAVELEAICKVLFGEQTEESAVVARNYDATGEGEVSLAKGEMVGVLQVHESGWAWVRRYIDNNSVLGWAPSSILSKPLPEWIYEGAQGYWWSGSQKKSHKVKITTIDYEGI